MAKSAREQAWLDEMTSLSNMRHTPLVQLERLARSLKVAVLDKEKHASRNQKGELLPEAYRWLEWHGVLAKRCANAIRTERLREILIAQGYKIAPQKTLPHHSARPADAVRVIPPTR